MGLLKIDKLAFLASLTVVFVICEVLLLEDFTLFELVGVSILLLIEDDDFGVLMETLDTLVRGLCAGEVASAASVPVARSHDVSTVSPLSRWAMSASSATLALSAPSCGPRTTCRPR